MKDFNSPFVVHTWGHSDQTPLKAYIRLELFWVPIPRHLLSTGYFVILYYFAEPNGKTEDRHVLGPLQSSPAVYLQRVLVQIIPLVRTTEGCLVRGRFLKGRDKYRAGVARD